MIANIRRSRGVPAKRGMRVFYRHENRFGTIVGARCGYLRIRLDGDKIAKSFHPTWKIDYLDMCGEVIYSSEDFELFDTFL
jgi:hypothetical protein